MCQELFKIKIQYNIQNLFITLSFDIEKFVHFNDIIKDEDNPYRLW